MTTNRIGSADTTNMSGKSYADTAAGKTADDKFAATVDSAQAENLIEYTNEWAKWKGFYDKVPQLRAVIQKKAMWTVGKGYTIEDEKAKERLGNIDGFGKDSLNSILFNQVTTYTICGDSFAEIIGESRKKFTNLKPLDPGTIKILGTSKGRLKGYEQFTWNPTTQKNELVNSFNKKEIFHMPYNRIGDAIHGTSTVAAIEDIILFHKEAMADMKTVFHRYVKPLIISEVDTDNETEIANYKAKLDNATANGENLVIPKGVLEKMQRMSIPRYSTLDPLPWIQLLEQQFVKAEGVPDVIQGAGKETTEATSKILYLAWQQVVEWNQLFVMECIKSQLQVDIQLKFPISIAPDLQMQNSKAKKANNFEMMPGQNTGG